MSGFHHAAGTDSIERIKACLNCPREECINCWQFGDIYGETPASQRRRERAEAVARLCEGSGITDVEIGRRLGLSNTAVYAYRKSLGIPPAKERVRYITKKEREIDEHRSRRLYEDTFITEHCAMGWTDSRIAKELGLSGSTVSNRRRALGIESSRATVRKERTLQVVSLFAEGLSDGEIAERIGVSSACVFEIRRDLGLKANNKGGGAYHKSYRGKNI